MLAQQNYQWGLQLHAGKILKHTSKLFINPPSKSELIAITFSKQTSGNKLWQQNFGRPKVGYQIVWQPTNNAQLLGQLMAVAPTIQFGLGKKQSSTFIISTGAGFATKHWQRIPYTDSINNYLGSTINFFVQLGYAKKILESKKVLVQGGAAFTHISNGGVRKPNFGINQASLFVSLQQASKQNIAVAENYKKVSTTKKVFKNKWGAACRIGGSFAEYGIADGPLLPIGVAAMQANYTIGKKHKLFAGLEAERNGKTDFFIKYTHQPSTNPWKDATYYSTIVGNEFLLGKASIYTQVGLFVNNPYLKSSVWYSKFGMLYYPFQKAENYGKGFCVGLLLKANGFTADYPEVGLGYSW